MSGDFTPQSQRVNIAKNSAISPRLTVTETDVVSVDTIKKEWELEKLKRNAAQIAKLEDPIEDILARKTKSLSLSPDEDMILYIASGSAKLPTDAVKQLPGSSTQKQVRDIKDNQTYIYDIKEDRNFLIDDSSDDVVIESGFPSDAAKRISWFPTSRHLIIAEANKITLMDYDGTNPQIVYSGNYVAPHAFSTLSLDRLVILTNLGAGTSPANLYSLGIK